MSAISNYATAVGTAFQTISDGTDSLVKSMAGITKDVTNLKATIEKLQNSSGAISDADQKLLDQTQQQANALGEKLKGVAAAAQALDDATEDLPEPPAPTTGDGSADTGATTPPAP